MPTSTVSDFSASGYRFQLSYQKAEIAEQITAHFSQRFLGDRDREAAAMRLAARSSLAHLRAAAEMAPRSKEGHWRQLSAARTHLEQLLGDYHAYLRTRRQHFWQADSTEARTVRELGRINPSLFEHYASLLEKRSSAVVANVAVCVLHQANYLLDRQLRSLEYEATRDGDPRLRMLRARRAVREHPERSLTRFLPQAGLATLAA